MHRQKKRSSNTGIIANLVPMADGVLGHFEGADVPDEPWASIRRASPDEYGKYVYPDYPKAKSPATLAKFFRKTEPDYYAAVRQHIAEHGVQEPMLLRYKDPGGRVLKRPVVMGGHHRAAAAWELGQSLPVGDYDNPEHYGATSDFAQQWWRDHQDLKAQYADPRSRTAAARPGRGQKTCLCCKGGGSHGDGSECDQCDESGLLHSDEEQRYCPGQPQPRRRHWRQPVAGANGPMPEDMEFRHQPNPYMTDQHLMTAHHGGRQVGYLEWGGPEGFPPNEVQDVSVDDGYRRRGIASEMLRRAREISPGLGHSSDLSDDAGGWAAHDEGQQFRAARGSFETADPEAQRRRFRRAENWLDRNTRREDDTVDIPADWGHQVSNQVIHGILDEHGWPRDESDREDHWSHIDPENIPVRQAFHHHQGFVHPETVKEKMAWSSEGSMHPDDQPAKVVRHQGKTYLLDGHHKWVGARLLGHEGMEAHVFDTSRPETYPQNCPECSEDDDDDLMSHFGALPGDGYGYEHRPLESGTPLHEGGGLPESARQRYAPGEVGDWDEAVAQFRHAQGNPDHQVRIYRAAPHKSGGMINRGDWVTTAHGYARDMADDRNYHDPDSLLTDPKTPPERFHVYEASVPARHLRGAGDMMEWGYWGDHIQGEHSSRCGQDDELEVSASAEHVPSDDQKELLDHFEAADSSEYHGVHIPPGGPDDDPEWAAPMHDVRNAMPRAYEAPRDYPGWDAESGRQLQAAEGRPDHPVTVYRALPADRLEFNTGDWVTTSGAYARQHGESNLRHTPWHVVRADVPARHLFNEGYMSEWGYQGPHIANPAIHYVGHDHDRREASLEAEASGDDYRLMHGAPSPEAGHKPLHYYTGEDPDDRVRIYRAAPPGTESINRGDWVSRNPAYAHRHGYGSGPGGSDWPVYTAEVHQKHVHWDENDEDEHGYNGPEIWHPDVHDEETGELHDWDSYHDAHPHGREAWIGSAVHMPQEDHEFVHDQFEDEEDRANRLLGHAHAQGALHAATWRGDNYEAMDDAVTRARQIEPPAGHRITMFHAHRKDDGRLADVDVKEYDPHADEPWRGGWRTIDTEETYPDYSHQALDEAGLGRQAAAGKYDDLDFLLHEEETGGTKHPVKHTLYALHPDGGAIGSLDYFPPKRANGRIAIDNMTVHPDHRRRGVASSLMDELQRRFPGASIDHGERTNPGQAWWDSYSEGKKVIRGRTITSDEARRQTASRVSTESSDATSDPKTAALEPSGEPLINPYHGTSEFGGRPEWAHTWFHGTRGDEPAFGNQKPIERERGAGMSWEQPNKYLGVHFSPLHGVAHNFAHGVFASGKPGDDRYLPGVPSSLVHAELHFRNPAHFPTESHLNLAVAQWASQHYPGWHDDKLNDSLGWQYSDQEGTHRDWSTPSDPGQVRRLGDHAQTVLQWHPHLPEITRGFGDHLRATGHEGIIYGNMVEGPGGFGLPLDQPKSFSAIATHPDQIRPVHTEHIAAPFFGDPPELKPGQVTHPQSGELNEPEDMEQRIIAYHSQHQGELPRKLAAAAPAPEYGPRPEYQTAPEGSSDDEEMAHFDQQREIRRNWDRHIQHGLSVGHLTAEQAGELGYRPSGHATESGSGRSLWQPLPHEMYHVTTDLPGVQAHGLKTRAELAQSRGHGLGGGEDDTISVTTDHELAGHILHSLHEFHDVVNGRLTPQQMWDQARRGDGASRPWHTDLAGYWDRSWNHGDQVPRGLEAQLRGVETKQGGLLYTPEEMNRQHGPGWRPHRDADTFKGAHGQDLYNVWERDLDPDQRREQAADFYKNWAAFRQHAGGRPDPMFFSTDTKAFAAKDPRNFAILHVRPKPGAQGYPVSSMSEWRTGSGDALEVHHAERAPGRVTSALAAPASLPQVLAGVSDAACVAGLWMPETPGEMAELLDGFPAFFGALADGLDILGVRLDDCPVDEHLPSIARSMASACRVAAEDAEEVNARVRASFFGGVNG